jgi:hypothetical protein
MADHPHTIDRWDDATGENLIEQIAAAGDYLVALETYRAAVKRWPNAKITLRNRALPSTDLINGSKFASLLPSHIVGCARRRPTCGPRCTFRPGYKTTISALG